MNSPELGGAARRSGSTGDGGRRSSVGGAARRSFPAGGGARRSSVSR